MKGLHKCLEDIKASGRAEALGDVVAQIEAQLVRPWRLRERASRHSWGRAERPRDALLFMLTTKMTESLLHWR